MFPSHKLPNGIAFQMLVRFFLVEGFLMLNEVLVYHIVVVFFNQRFHQKFQRRSSIINWQLLCHKPLFSYLLVRRFQVW